EIAKDWPIFIGGIVSTTIASNALGYLLARRQVLPGTTAIWGSSPGAASAMTFLAEAYGADVRLVAVMQYLRVVLVAVSASIVALIWVSPDRGAASVDWFPPVDWPSLAATLALAAAGAWAGRRSRLPAGQLLLPLALGVLLHDFGLLKIELPPWLLAASYALVGWSIGLRFTRPIILHAARALPILAVSVLTLIALCGGFAAALVHFAGLDPLTAFLATSPGGADSVAIIAASSDVDLQFVMTMQTARLVIVLLTGPSVARFIARRIERRRAAETPPSS
ncbi:AbrB family transcriptional regulator, partial [Methylopila sp. Yamaguchi]|uniref:AbrB family transcriptional regulator n=1 Tax=Methylopila sp. Yamaguchi TaxID=1437817 RepID=UPI000CCC6442